MVELFLAIALAADLGLTQHAPLNRATHYATLSGAQCSSELTERGVAFEALASARGVPFPVRFLAPVRGIEFRAYAAGSKMSVYDILDCRLALALDDLASVWSLHGVTRVLHMSMYRPPSGKTWPERKAGQRHGAGLAIDVGTLVFAGGQKLVVDTDFGGHLAGAVCGDGAAPNPRTTEANLLRLMTCEVVASGSFHVVLTPNFNKPHHNHLHLEVSPKAANGAWVYLR